MSLGMRLLFTVYVLKVSFYSICVGMGCGGLLVRYFLRYMCIKCGRGAGKVCLLFFICGMPIDRVPPS